MIGGRALAFQRVCFVIALFWLAGALIHALQSAGDLGWFSVIVFAQYGLLPALLVALLGRLVLFAFKRQ